MIKSSLKFQISKLFLLLFIFSYVSVFAADTLEENDFLFAKRAFSDGFYDLAKERLENFLSIYPQSTPRIYEAHLLLGRCFYYQNNLTRAIHEFDIVLNARDGSGLEDEALYWTGETYLKSQDPKRALEYYEKIIAGFPSSKILGYAVYSKGWCYYKLGLLEEAIRAFKEVVSGYPFDKIAIEAQFRIGECEYLLRYIEWQDATLSSVTIIQA
ncbi:MAG: tetratricopeptide repeat protein [Candidatus Omnitrophica bacterium]|nr:tetratricopeptide repeat protein [Candidatus Omnitrophota bacterium]